MQTRSSVMNSGILRSRKIEPSTNRVNELIPNKIKGVRTNLIRTTASRVIFNLLDIKYD